MTEPMVEFVGMEEIKDRVARFILDGKHWLLLPGFSGANALNDLENTFYSGEKNNDFEMAMIPITGMFLPVLTIAFAHKKHLSAAEFAEHVRTQQADADAPLTQATFEQKDVIFMARRPEAQLLAADFYNWIKPTLEKIERENKSHG